jgi:lipoprotein-anchoring transpeptidase ErfK/SrfK
MPVAATRGAVAVVALGLLLTGCGGGSKSKTPTTAGGTSSVGAAASPVLGREPSKIAAARTGQVQIYRQAGGGTPSMTLRNPNPDGAQRVFLVIGEQNGWLHVLLPVPPNGSKGWIKASDVVVQTTTYWIQVQRSGHRLYVYRGTTKVLDVPAAIGTQDTPTPGGLYYIAELLKAPNPRGDYGPYAYGLSGYSTSLKQFGGHDPIIGIHGTNQPKLVGTSVSHGCVRVRNDVITKMAKMLPLGTPVDIQA